ncbi:MULTISPECIES: hypothetical protein [unclassified Microcoleus]|uniref:hypothetical protein n=1 Tax=unclassified Microcoleus TaxID=2642155 RepID=UPI002FD3B590
MNRSPGTALCYLRFILGRVRAIAGSHLLQSLSFALEYQSCRIRVPDLELPVAAILVDREYYSFFNAVQELSKVLAIVAKLGNRGDSTAITKTEARLCNLG